MTIHTGHWPTPSGELVAVAREWPDADAARAALASRSAEGLVSATAYEGVGHDGAFTYEQWTSEDAIKDLDGAPVYRLYRGGRGEGEPGVLVVVSVEFDRADERQQREWVDLVFAALDSEPTHAPGGVSGFFHLSIDGRRMLNYAEWTSEEAHIAALEAPGDKGGIGTTDAWKAVRQHPGMKSSTVKRYRPILSAVAA
ncbi:antibiotic biosynthesis monooxygenase [Amycolatopsis orientalis]|uniref:antibiotic biosynthesis monooxygenase n=1 Tax=Amycolatopsis orientalis TaxID=31958 RepID=UPI000420D5E8|nr:antibiotic biosynthesis monooxygenase [Amycolatopsis orientalis]